MPSFLLISKVRQDKDRPPAFASAPPQPGAYLQHRLHRTSGRGNEEALRWPYFQPAVRPQSGAGNILPWQGSWAHRWTGSPGTGHQFPE